MSGRISYYGGIVKDGLILDLDAGKLDSYNRIGTTWNDISNNKNNGTLTNGPTYNSSNGGGIVFDGVDDYVGNIGSLSTFSFVQNTSIFTINMWVKFNNTTGRNALVSNSTTSTNKGFSCIFDNVTYGAPINKTFTKSLLIAILRGVGGQYYIYSTDDNIITSSNTWYNVCFVSNSSTGQIYLNGSPVTTTLYGVYGLSSGNSTNQLRVGNNTGIQFLDGNGVQFSIYNRNLSASEVLQNYNALKGRFNL